MSPTVRVWGSASPDPSPDIDAERHSCRHTAHCSQSRIALPGAGAARQRRPTEPPVAVAQPWPSDTSWRHIGPAAFGGRVDDIEAVPGDPRIIFVASAAGGVFRSKNNGTTWDAVFDKSAIRSRSATSRSRRAIRESCGRARVKPNNRQSSTWGDGVYRSIDGGTTWQHMGLRETQTIGRIVIDPHNADIVFVAAVGHLFGPNDERGLYRTKDGGTTWQKVLCVDANTGATDVVISPDGRTLIAAMYQRRRREFGFAGSGPGSGLWRSTDGGDTWQRVASGMPVGRHGSNRPRHLGEQSRRRVRGDRGVSAGWRRVSLRRSRRDVGATERDQPATELLQPDPCRYKESESRVAAWRRR